MAVVRQREYCLWKYFFLIVSILLSFIENQMSDFNQNNANFDHIK